MVNKDKWWGPITLILLMALIGFAYYCISNNKTISAGDMIVTGLLLRLGTMLDYRYGSSRSSHEKTDALINKQNPNP